MKKPAKVALAVVGGIIVIGAIASAGGGSDKKTTPNSNSNSTANTQQSSAQPAAEKMTIKNSTYKDDSGLKQVVGEITNNDTGMHSATIKATFYAADGSIKGTASGAVNDVAPGDTKTFTLLTTDDVTGYKNMKVQVDTLL